MYKLFATKDGKICGITPKEIIKVLNLILFILRSFGFNEYKVYLSTRPDKFVGSEEGWEKATNALKNALENTQLTYELDLGEGVFYVNGNFIKISPKK